MLLALTYWVVVPAAPAQAALPAGGMSAAAVQSMFSAYGNAGGHWTGADGTTSIALPDGRLAWFFSDTFLGTVNADGSRPNSTPMVSNSLVVQDGTSLTTITGGTANAPRPLAIPSQPGEFLWVGDGVVEGGVLKVIFNRYKATGSGPLGFQHTGTALVTFALPALTVTSVTDLPVGARIVWGSGVMVDGGFTYIYGQSTAPGRMTFGHVARVAVGSLGSPWQFWNGSAWVASETAAARILSGVGTGYSVQKVGTQYVLLTHENNLLFDSQIATYTATTPAGPFTGPSYVFTAPERAPGGSVIVYDAKLHPALATQGKLLFSYNVNSLTFSDALASVNLYRPRFVEIAWPIAAPGTGRPSTPTGLTVAAQDDRANLAWGAASGATSYRVYQRDVTGGQTGFARLPSSFTSTSAAAGLLVPGHTYQFKVTASNAAGESSFSSTVTVTPQSTADAASVIHGANRPNAIPGSYIVRLKEAQGRSLKVSDYAEQLASQTGGTVGVLFPLSLGGFSVNLTEVQAKNLAAHPDVADIYQDGQAFKPAAIQTNPPAHLDRLDQRDLPLDSVFTFPNNGSASRAYVLDTGVRSTSGSLGGRVATGFNASDGSTNTPDCPATMDHGTAVAAALGGGLHGLAKGATIVPVKVFECVASDYVTTEAVVTRGVEWAISDAQTNSGAAVINMSFSGPKSWTSGVLEAAITSAMNAGIPVVAAAGNDNGGDACNNSPGYMSQSSDVITVGASTAADGVGSFSNVGKCLTLFAIGEGLNLPDNRGDASTRAVFGTSFAAPQVAGAIAIMQSGRGGAMSPGELKSALVAASTVNKLTLAPNDPGSPNRLLFVEMWPTAAPTLSAASRPDGSIGLTWTPVNQPNIEYIIEQRDVTTSESFAEWGSPVAGATTATATNLQEGHVYEFRVKAANTAGTGPLSNIASATAHMAPPAAPTGLTATARTDGGIALSWTSMGPGIGYWVYQRDITAGESAFTKLPLPLEGNAMTAGQLLHAHTYEYRVSAYNIGGEGPQSLPAQATANYPPPAAPTGLIATAGDAQVRLTWTASATPNVWYLVHQRDVTEGQVGFTQLPLPITTCCAMTAGLLKNGHTYEFKVTASANARQSGDSNVVTATPREPLPAQVTGLSATSQTDGTIALAWASAGTGLQYEIYQRDVTAGQATFTKLPLPIACCAMRAGFLTHNHVYEFKVTAVSGSGAGAASAPAQATARYTPPGAPTNLRGTTAGSATVALDWDPPAAGDFYYWVYSRDVTAGATAFTKSAVPTTSSSANLGLLLNGHVYEFKVSASNQGGEGPASTTVRVTPVGSLPAPASGLTAAAGNASALLRWTASATAGAQYMIYQRDVTAAGSWVKLPIPVTGTSFTAGLLTNGRTYEFKVTAVTAGGESPASNVASARPLPPAAAAPTGLSASAGDARATLSWVASTTSSVYYWIEYRPSGGVWQRLPLPLSTCCSFVVTALTNGTTYEFRVLANNLAGDSAPSNTATARPLPPLPAAPSALSATAGNATVTLSWSASPTPSVFYWIERQAQGGTWQRLPYPVTTCCSFAVQLLTNGITYSFRVRAGNAAGDSAATNTASALPMPPLPTAPSNLRLVKAEARGTTLTWAPSTSTSIYYQIYLRNASRSGTWSIGPGFLTGTSAYVQYLRGGDIYEFRVVAQNMAGESLATNTVSSRIPYALASLRCQSKIYNPSSFFSLHRVTTNGNGAKSSLAGEPWVVAILSRNGTVGASMGHRLPTVGDNWTFPAWEFLTNLSGTWQVQMFVSGPNGEDWGSATTSSCATI